MIKCLLQAYIYWLWGSIFILSVNGLKPQISSFRPLLFRGVKKIINWGAFSVWCAKCDTAALRHGVLVFLKSWWPFFSVRFHPKGGVVVLMMGKLNLQSMHIFLIITLLSKYGPFWLQKNKMATVARMSHLRLQNGGWQTNGWWQDGYVHYLSSVYVQNQETGQ